MSFLDIFLSTDPAERAADLAALEEICAQASRCDCDRCCASCPHEPWCPAVAGSDD